MNEGDVNATTETRDARAAAGRGARPEPSLQGSALILRERTSFSGDEGAWSSQAATSEDGQPSQEMVARMVRLEAAMGATLSLLRRCIVEHSTPTREQLAAEAGFVFGTSREAAMAELDEVAQMVGVSSIR
jgi:hypothetical protein